jgi:hypothetical protein
MFDKDEFTKWENIIQDVPKERIPVEVIKKLILKLEGRRQRTVNVQLLFEQGLDSEEVETVISDKLEQYHGQTVSVEFILDIEGISEIIQPETDELLRGL